MSIPPASSINGQTIRRIHRLTVALHNPEAGGSFQNWVTVRGQTLLQCCGKHANIHLLQDGNQEILDMACEMGRRIVKQFRLCIIPIAILLLLSLTGCPPPEEDKDKEKPATPEEIRAEGQKILQAMNQLQGTPPDQLAAKVQTLRQQMRTFREKHGQTNEGKTMILQISQTGYDMALLLFQLKQYALCVSACDLALEINRTHEPTLELRRQAQEELNKPRVVLKAFFNDIASGKLYAWVEVTYQGQEESKQVQVGEEFDGYRFMRIVKNVQGKPTGIVLRYIKTGNTQDLTLE